MEKLILTQLTTEELRQIIREEFLQVLKELKLINQEPVEDIIDFLGAVQFLGLAKSTLYQKTSSREIPHFKRGRKLYFKRSELIKFIEKGKQTTVSE